MFGRMSTTTKSLATAARMALAFSMLSILTACLGSGGNAVDNIVNDPNDQIGKSALVFDPGSLAMGNSQKAPAFVEATVTIKNTAVKPIFLKSFASDNSVFSVSNNGCPMAPLQLDSLSTCVVKFKFSPTADGDVSGVLTATYGLEVTATDKYTVNLGWSGRAITQGVGNPGLSFNPSVYDFGEVALAPAFRERTLSVTNVTAADVYVSGFSTNTTMFTVVSTTCPIAPLTLAKNASCDVVARFSPLARGAQVGALAGIYGTAVDQPGAFSSSITLSGISAAPALSNPAVTSAPDYWDFGDTALHVTASKTFTISNTSASTVYLASVAISPVSADFQLLSTTCPTGLNPFAAAATCSATIAYTPSVEGVSSTNLMMNYGATTGSTSLTSKIVVTGRSSPVTVSSGTLSFNPSFWDFGDVSRNAAVTKAIVIKNTSSTAIVLGSITRTAPTVFTISHNCPISPATFGGGAECTVTYTFTPDSDGAFSSDLTVSLGADAARSGSVQSKMSVIGRSVAVPVGNTAILASPDYWDFGNVTVNTTATKVFTLSNNRDSSIYLSTIAIDPTGTDFQVLSNTCPTGLNPFTASATCSITATFSPTTEQTSSAGIKLVYGLTSGSTNLSAKVLVAGRSAAPPVSSGTLTFTPTFWDFGNIDRNVSVTKTITVRNSSTASVVLGSITNTATANFGVTHNCPTTPAVLAASAQCVLTVVFTPNADGAFNSDITINLGPDAARSGSVQSKVSVIGRSVAVPVGNAAITSSPDYWDFGNIALTNTSSKVFTITNNSTAAIYISSVAIAPTGTDFQIQSTTCPTGLNPFSVAATCTVTAAFAPGTETVAAAGINFIYGLTTGATNLNTKVLLAGRSAPAPVSSGTLTFNPTFWDFGEVARSATVSKAITITNTSTSAVVIGGLTNTATANFAIAHNCPTTPSTLAANGQCTLTVSFTPNADGGYASDITVNLGPDASRSSSVQSRVSVIGRSLAVPVGNTAITADPNYWDFGNTALNATVSKTFVVTNNRDTAIYLSTISVAPAGTAFQIQSTTCPTGLNPFAGQAVCTVTAAFTPTVESVVSANINFVYGLSTGATNLNSTILMAGRSAPAPVSAGTLSFSPGFWDFGDVPRNTAISKTFTITNNSTSSVVLGGITRTAAANFTIAHNCPITPSVLASNATCTLTVAFTPNADGGYASDITVNLGPDAARSSTVQSSFFVIGRSVAIPLGNPALNFSPDYWDFGNVATGVTGSKTITVTNNSADPLYLGSITSTSANTDLQVLGTTCPTGLNAFAGQASCTVTVTFAPTVDGPANTNILVTYGTLVGATNLNSKVVLIGRSTPPPVSSGNLTFTPDFWDFGDVARNTSVSKAIVIKNTSAVAVYLGSIDRTSTATFGQSNNCPMSPSTLAPNATCTVTMTFTPTADGGYGSVLSVNLGPDSGHASAVQMNVTLIGRSVAVPVGNAALTYTPAYWDFGDVGINLTATKVFTVANNTTSSIYLSSIITSPSSAVFNLLSTTCPTGLNPFAPAATCTVTATFNPTVEIATSTTLLFTYGTVTGGTNLSSTIVMIGRSSPPPVSSGNLSFTPSFWDFGDVARNTSVTKTITIKNVSTSTIVIGDLTRTSTANFAIAHNCPTTPTTFAPNATCTASITFLPTADGSYSTDLTVSYGPDAARSSTVQSKVSLIGRSLATPLGNAAVSFSQNYLDFGDIAVGVSATQSITVTNSGTIPVYLASSIASTDGDFTVYGSNCPTGSSSLAVAATCTFGIRYIPSATGIKSANVVLSYGFDQVRNSNLNSQIVVTGRSTAGTTGNNAYTFSPSYWDFGDVAAGVTVQKAITVTNSSNDPVFISSIARTNTTVFGVSHDCPTSPSALASGGVCTVTVTFTPAADGGQSSLISILYGPDAPRSANLTAKFSVSGRSTAASRGNASIVYTPAFWDFGDVPRNTTQDKVFSITNTSTAGVYLSTVNLDAAGSYLITSSSCPTGATALAPAATCSVNVRFSPTADTLEAVNLRTYYGPDQARSGNLLATAVISGRSQAVPAGQAVFSVTPSFYDFGDIAQTNSATNAFVITNTSGGNIYISGITRSNTGAFTVSNNCPASPLPLASAAICTVTLGFAPNAEGAHNTRVDIVHGLASASSSNLTFSFFAQGRSTAAATGNSSLTFTPNTWDFGDIAASNNVTKAFTLTNAGATSVYLGAVATDNAKFTVSANTCPTGSTALAAAATCTVTGRFAPTADGAQNSILTYHYGPDQARAANLLAPLTLFGRSTAAPIGNTAVTFTPSYWDFGDVAAGQVPTKVFTVKNTYSSTISISSFTSSDSRVTLSDTCPRSPSTLAANATCNLTASFAPTTDGAYASQIKIFYGPDDARSANIQTVLDVAGRSTSTPTGNPALTFNPTYKDFGNILVGQNNSATFTLTNTSTAAVYLNGAVVGNTNYSITSNSCPTGATALAANANCSIAVKYTPTVEQSDIDYLTVSYGPDQARHANLAAKANLIGVSSPPPVGNAAMTLSPNTYDFGSVALSPAFADQTITVTNSSARALFFGTMAGLVSPYSVSSTTCPTGTTSLAASGTCTITVRFAPTAGAQVTGTLQVNYGVSSSATTTYNSTATFTGRSNPNPPTNFNFTAGNGTSATFTWAASDFDQATFQIERCTGITCQSTFPTSDPTIPAGVDRISGIDKAVRTFTWNSANTTGLPLSEGQVYRFRIRGVAGSTTSAWLTSAPIIAFGGATSVDNATGLATSMAQINCNLSSAAGTYVGLYWNSVPNAAYYQIFDVETGTAKFVRNVDAPASTTVLTGLTSAVEKSYLVKAFTDSGVSSINVVPNILTTTLYTPCAVIGQAGPGNWNMNNGMLNPRAMWIDTTTTPKRMFLADQGNNRVLIWNTIPTSSSTPADVVLGQPDFNSFLANNSGDRLAPAIRSAKSLSAPQGIFAKGGKLYVTDTSNQRVLIWNTIPSANFTPADVVVGQANFLAATAIGTTNCNAANNAKVMNNPMGVFVDNSNAMYVVDRSNHRVMVWNTIPTTNYAAADIVLGESTTAGVCPSASTTQSTLNSPEGIYVSNNDVFVDDRSNRRIMRFTKPLTTGMNASNYWGGAGNFTTIPTAACSGTNFNDPIGIWGDDTAGSTNIFVADYGQHRVMRFASGNWGNDPTANSVIGEPNNTTCAGGDTNILLRNPIAGFASNSATADAGVWIANYQGHRVNKFSYANGTVFTAGVAQASSMILGQPRYTTIMSNIGPVNDNKSIVRPMGISVGNLGATPHTAVSDYATHRVFLYDTAITGHLPAATHVLGQTNYTSVEPNQNATAAANTFNTPAGVWTDGIHLLVADPTNHRVLGWRSWPTTDTQSAGFVLGQTAFTNSGATVTGTGLNFPMNVYVSDYPGSSSYHYIWVTDTNNNRIVAYQTNWSNSPADPVSPPSVQSAVLVLGQTLTTTNTANTTQTGLRGPRGIWSNGVRTVVADTLNHRVMIWDQATTPASGANADIVLGQPDFVSNTANNGGISASTMNFPVGVFVDATGRLYVADNNNHRILVWDTFPTASGQPADRVIGQTTFSTAALNAGLIYPSAMSFQYPAGLWLDSGRLFVTDGLNINNVAPNSTTNNRITIFPGF